jgi:UDPglucose--hexose-1-phosphate uridylyltransferase
MGLAVLPSRLKTEMAILKDAILENKDIKADERIAKHYDWTMKIKAKYDDINAQNCEQILRDEIGLVFTAILEQCGVFDRTEAGRAQFKKFINSVK